MIPGFSPCSHCGCVALGLLPAKPISCVGCEAPQPWLEAHSPKSWEACCPSEAPPKSAWMREGNYVPCDACDDWEPTQC